MEPLAETIARLEEYDEIIVSGTASSPQGLELTEVPGMIGTLDRREPATLKLWPVDESLGDGKVWILLSDITAVKIVQEDEHDEGEPA